MVSTQSDAMTRAQALMRQKDEIEAEIKKSQDELQSQKVGMTDRLVDNSGFPRADIDLVVVTTARSNIIKLKNDHKDIMVQIEEALHAVHAEALAEKQREQERKRQEAASSSSSSSAAATDLSATQNKDDERGLAPFARVNAVAPDSPAQDAGLLQHDRIVSFGIVNINTDDVLPSLSAHVQSRENKPIVVKVLRGESTDPLSLILVPKQGWGGRGLLGCHIIPI
ncbi:26S proteasome non-ATPase regulatory subunit 9 [Dissophora globulifera]|uniref:Probable 26S proteasome regulatory subunit p27 n=1 Tax=Dissophora globulifera TaxID=979702 RepID=A0A9P6USB7_9FUNG|nr:26S proteasome non-ATPase regulatory subunit 9 [Dissophora globulifera]